jgi:hypothetical protein
LPPVETDQPHSIGFGFAGSGLWVWVCGLGSVSSGFWARVCGFGFVGSGLWVVWVCGFGFVGSAINLREYVLPSTVEANNPMPSDSHPLKLSGRKLALETCHSLAYLLQQPEVLRPSHARLAAQITINSAQPPQNQHKSPQVASHLFMFPGDQHML